MLCSDIYNIYLLPLLDYLWIVFCSQSLIPVLQLHWHRPEQAVEDPPVTGRTRFPLWTLRNQIWGHLWIFSPWPWLMSCDDILRMLTGNPRDWTCKYRPLSKIYEADRRRWSILKVIYSREGPVSLSKLLSSDGDSTSPLSVP